MRDKLGSNRLLFRCKTYLSDSIREKTLLRTVLLITIQIVSTIPRCTMSYSDQSKLLAGPMALLKTFLSVSGGEISDDCVQIFGGRGITEGGMGQLINQHQKSYKFDSILGGSEEGTFL